MDAGLVIVDKPAGLTSHDVVARLRRILGTRKIGHAGTLDPMATGVLVCGAERGTKLLGHLALDTKAYTATIRLGATTTSDDAEGEVVDTADPAGVTDEAIAAGVAALPAHFGVRAYVPVAIGSNGQVDVGATREGIATYAALGVTMASVGLGRNLTSGRDIAGFVQSVARAFD